MEELTAAEIEQYQQHGFVTPRMRLDTETLHELEQAVERVIAANPEVRPERLVSVHITGRNQEGVVGDPAFFELARHPRILRSVQQVLGPDVILWGCQLFCKPAQVGMEVPMHQDGQYWPIRPLATCTVWVAIDASTPENGCMRVVPGSHHQGLLAHEKDLRDDLVLNQKVLEPERLSEPVDLELAPGGFSLHDVHLVHGSNPNRSGKRRAGVALRYMPATSLFDRSLMPTGSGSGYLVNFAERPLWLLSGRDHAGNDLHIGHTA
ncbi:MAG: phytanoyl-CoA dioxygenase family protein [bacterium]|jgi:ectoine hydroxylase-related dioxygenase (phytanoyl-CoA dioxygenase family)